MFENIRQDLRRSYYRKVSLWHLPIRFISYHGFRAVAIYRMARWCHTAGIPVLPAFLMWLNEFKHGCHLHYKADVGPGLTLPHPFGVSIGRHSKVGRNAQFFQGSGIGPAKKQSPTVGTDFTAHAGAQIVGGITLGDRVTVGANCTVIFDIESDSTVAPGKTLIFKNKQEDNSETKSDE